MTEQYYTANANNPSFFIVIIPEQPSSSCPSGKLALAVPPDPPNRRLPPASTLLSPRRTPTTLTPLTNSVHVVVLSITVADSVQTLSSPPFSLSVHSLGTNLCVKIKYKNKSMIRLGKAWQSVSRLRRYPNKLRKRRLSPKLRLAEKFLAEIYGVCCQVDY